MKDPDTHDDWLALGDDWRAQAVSAVDVDALRNEVLKRGRRLRWALIHELAGFALAMGLCLWVLVSDRAGMAPAVTIGLMGILLGFQGWSLWIRRRQMGDSGLDALAMVDLEIARAQTSLRYWRVSIWLAVGMWVMLYALVVLGLAVPMADTGDIATRKLFHGLWGGGAVGIGFAVWAWWSGRRNHARREQMLRLRDELLRD